MTRRLVATLHIALCAQALALAAGAAWWIRTAEHGSEPWPWPVMLVVLSPVLGLALLHAGFAARTWARPSAWRGAGIALALWQVVLQGMGLGMPPIWGLALAGLALALALLAAVALVEAPSLPRPRRAA